MKKALIKSLFFIAVVCAALLNGCQHKDDKDQDNKKKDDKSAPAAIKPGFVVLCDTIAASDTVRLKTLDKSIKYYRFHGIWKNNHDYSLCINISDPKDSIDHVEMLIVKNNHDIVTSALLVKGSQEFTYHNTDGRFTPNLVLIYHMIKGKTHYPTSKQVSEGACKTGQTQKENAKSESSKNVTVLVSLDQD